MEDYDIISLCRKGDKEAFGLLVKKYQTSILSFTWSILKDKEKARDVTQESFIQAYRNLDRIDLSKSFKNWLFTIASNKSLDYLRKEKSILRTVQNFIGHKQPSLNQNEMEQWALVHRGKLVNLMDKLNERERIFLHLKIQEGYTSPEIAEIFKCAESTVRVYIMNARKKLQKYFKETGNEVLLV